MIVYSKHSLEEILPFIRKDSFEKNRIKLWKFNVRIWSDRLVLFKNNLECVICWIKWDHFILESNWNPTPNLNLYTKKGILMTKDHIIPKSKWWKNNLSNYQTMCTICNFKKDNKIQ